MKGRVGRHRLQRLVQKEWEAGPIAFVKSSALGWPCPWKVLILRNTPRHEGCNSEKKRRQLRVLPLLPNKSTDQTSSSPQPAWLHPPPPSTSLLPSHHPQECSADVAWSKLPPGMTKKPPNDKPWQSQRGHSPFPSTMYFLQKHLLTVSRPHSLPSAGD